MALADTRARLANGYYNSNAKSAANPGGMASGGHQQNFPAALIDLGLVLIQAGIDAQALSAAQPSIAAAIAAVANAQAQAQQAQNYAGQALQYRNEAQQIVGVDLTLKANLNSPAFTGAPTAPTPAQGDVSTRIATTSYVDARIGQLIGNAPAALDTFYELAAMVGNDPNHINNLTTLVGQKFDKTGGDLSGSLTFPNVHQTERAIFFQMAAGRVVYLFGNVNGVGLWDSASGGGSVWNYNATSKILDLRSGVTAGGYTVFTAGNLSPLDTSSGQIVVGVKQFQAQATSIAAATYSALKVASTGGGAYFELVRPGVFNVFFGLDSDNQLKFGGGSYGVAALRLWHEGNDGAGSGMDSDMCRGAVPDTGASAGSLVKRLADGSIQAYAMRVNEFLRITGNDGIYWEAHGGGWYMSDANWVRVYGGKNVTTSGVMSAANYTVTSDRRLKSDITPLGEVGDLIDQLGVYSYLKGGRREWGVIAQELAAEPRLAHLVGDTGEVPVEGEPPLMTVDTGGLLALVLAELRSVRSRLVLVEAER
jgi:hypothetical protein